MLSIKKAILSIGATCFNLTICGYSEVSRTFENPKIANTKELNDALAWLVRKLPYNKYLEVFGDFQSKDATQSADSNDAEKERLSNFIQLLVDASVFKKECNKDILKRYLIQHGAMETVKKAINQKWAAIIGSIELKNIGSCFWQEGAHTMILCEAVFNLCTIVPKPTLDAVSTILSLSDIGLEGVNKAIGDRWIEVLSPDHALACLTFEKNEKGEPGFAINIDYLNEQCFNFPKDCLHIVKTLITPHMLRIYEIVLQDLKGLTKGVHKKTISKAHTILKADKDCTQLILKFEEFFAVLLSTKERPISKEQVILFIVLDFYFAYQDFSALAISSIMLKILQESSSPREFSFDDKIVERFIKNWIQWFASQPQSQSSSSKKKR